MASQGKWNLTQKTSSSMEHFMMSKKNIINFTKELFYTFFFTQPLESLHVINKSGERQVRAAIKRNEQIISRCSKEIEKNHKLYPEMTLEDMQFEQKKLFPLLLQFNDNEEFNKLNLPIAFLNTVDGV